MSSLSFAALASALMPVLFVLLLGYGAGRYHSFNTEQASGFSTLALNFALPAALFVGMTHLKRADLLQQGPLLLAIFFSYAATYGVSFAVARRSKAIGKAGAPIIALLVSFPAAPVYGLAVLTPLFGASGTTVVGLSSLVCNLTLTPVTLVLLARSSGASGGGKKPKQSQMMVIRQAFESPLVWAPLFGVVLVLLGVSVPALVDQSLELLGTSSSGVAIFASGLVLAAHKVKLSREVWLVSLGRVLAAPALLLLVLLVFHVRGPVSAATLVATALPSAVLAVLLATKHGVVQSLASTVLFVTSLAMIVILPLMMAVAGLVK